MYSPHSFLLSLLTQDDCHTNWVSCVRFSPNAQNPVIVSCGWDKLVKVGSKQFTSGSQPFRISPYPSSHPTGVEPHQLQAKDQPFWSQWLPELCDSLTGWLTLCIRRKGETAGAFGWCALIRIDLHPSPVGWQCYALGLE